MKEINNEDEKSVLEAVGLISDLLNKGYNIQDIKKPLEKELDKNFKEEVKSFLEENFPNDINFKTINTGYGHKFYDYSAITEKGLLLYKSNKFNKIMCMPKHHIKFKGSNKWCYKLYNSESNKVIIPLCQLVAESFIDKFNPLQHEIYEGFNMKVVDKNKIKYLIK